MLTSSYSLAPRTCRRLLLGVMAVLMAGFVIQVFGPLRVDTDVGWYLSVAASFADGYGLNLYGHTSPVPAGYPVIVGLMDRAGLAGAPALVALNVVCLAGALGLLYLILRRECKGSDITVLTLIVLFMSSFVMVKYLPRPRSETVGLLSTWAALWCVAGLRHTHGRRKLWRLLASGLLVVAAIGIRAAGIALIPALAWALVPVHPRRIQTEHRVRLWCVMLGAAALLGIAVYWAFTSTYYFQHWMSQLKAASLQWQLFFTARAKLNELGQLALNVPAGVAPPVLRPVLKGIGLGVLLLMVYALWHRRRLLSPVDVFVLANLGMLFLWPGDAPRLWLPVLPFIGLYIIPVIARMVPIRARAALAGLYLVSYVALGLGVQVALTREAFSKDFVMTYGNGSLAGEYRAALEGPGHGEIDDADLFRVLLRFHAKASAEWNKAAYPPYLIPEDE